MGWAFLGSFSLKLLASLEVLLFFTLLISSFCFPPPEKALWHFHSQLFSISC